MKQSRLTNFFAVPLEKNDSEPNVLSEIAETREVTQKENVNASLRYIQSVKRQKFIEEWCKEMKWLSCNHSTGIARCEICVLHSELADYNFKVVNGFSAPFKLET
jgi:hypothetical protein